MSFDYQMSKFCFVLNRIPQRKKTLGFDQLSLGLAYGEIPTVKPHSVAFLLGIHL